jgi:hypothetical protein
MSSLISYNVYKTNTLFQINHQEGEKQRVLDENEYDEARFVSVALTDP